MQTKSVYVGMCADIIHPGHINILKHAASFGNVTVGLLTEEAICTYKPKPLMSFEQRKIVIESIKWVTNVITQEHRSPIETIQSLKPDFFVHGDDWCMGEQSKIREEVISALKEWNGTLIEIPYTKGISSSLLKSNY